MKPLLFWAPRILGLAFAVFLSLFALDAFSGAQDIRGIVTAIPAFVIHLMPAGIVLLVVGIAWRFPRAGALLFFAAACAYAAMVWGRSDWILVISGPLVLVGVLFLLQRPPTASR